MTSPSPTTNTTSSPLTQHLLTLSPTLFTAATQTPFLRLSGQGKLSKAVLEKWLRDDRLYAQSYLRFSSLLLSTLARNLPREVKREALEERLVDAVLEAVVGIRRELGFFEDVGGEYARGFLEEKEEEGKEGGNGEDRDGGALRREFIPNWTSGEFVGFVERVGGLVDEVWEGVDQGLRSQAQVGLERLWMDILDVEQMFWPVVDEEEMGLGE
ncbi:hypothetical protein EG329_009199 [Mollisiaceae sp. DMI_Dod_QoI]|nr:hypothetical protein EG329_009199 [Helotiales sp. DMI_Dod_QoI]